MAENSAAGTARGSGAGRARRAAGGGGATRPAASEVAERAEGVAALAVSELASRLIDF